MERRPFGLGAALAAGVAAAIWLVWLLPSAPVSGDAFVVYFPTLWKLQDGAGPSAFLALQHGSYRMPGYPVLLYLFTLFGASEDAAVSAIAVLFTAALVAIALRLLSLEVGRTASCLAIVFFLASPCFLEAAHAASPDLACFALVLGVLWLARESPSPRRMLAGGALSAAAVLLRFNAVFLPIFLLITARDRRSRLAVVTGALATFVPWMAVSFAVKRRIFWIASAHSSVGFHPQFLTRHKFPEQLLAEAPFEFLWRAAYRGLIGGPIEIGANAGLWIVSIAALFALPAIWRAPADRVKWWMLLLFLSWLTIAPIHFEARYYPLQVLAIALLAAHVLAKKRVIAVLAGGAAIALSLGTAEPYRRTIARVDAFRADAVELARGSLPEGCISSARETYEYTPLRQAFRQEGLEDRLCCCGREVSGAAAFVFENERGELQVEVLTSTSAHR